MTPETSLITNTRNINGKVVSFREPQEEDFYPATYVLESEKEIRSLWYTSDEHLHMLREYKMTSEIQMLVASLQSERAHRLSSILLKTQTKSARRSSSPSKRRASPSQRNNRASNRITAGHRCRSDSAALSKLIVQLSSQRNRITHLTTSENIKAIIHHTSTTTPNLVDESTETEEPGELIRAKQKFNRLFRQLNRALAAR